MLRNLTAQWAAARSLQREWVLSVGVMMVAAVIAFSPVMTVLFDQWSTNDTYSFGALVPLISGCFVWMQRERLARLPIIPSPWVGSMLVGFCAALLAFGRAVGVIGVQEIAMVLMVPASVWLLCGRRYVSALWFPLFYLLLMLPIWEILTDRFHYRFQLFSAWLGGSLLSQVGIPVHRNGTYLELPNVILEVASVCSGVNFLVAVIAIGVPQAYLFLRGLMPRAVVIAFAVAIAIFSNGLRIAIIGILSYYQVTQDIHGPGHLLQGLFVSAAGLIALQMAIGFLARRYPKERPVAVEDATPAPAVMSPWGVMSFVAVTAMVLLAAANFRPPVLAASPAVTAAPSGNAETSPRPMEFVQGGDSLNLGRTFRTGMGGTVDLFTGDLAYAEPGGGLGYRRVAVPTNTALSELPIQTAQGTVLVNTVSFRDGDRATDVAFWYDVNGAVTPQVTTAKLRAIWGLLTGRPRPLLVVVVRTSVDSESNSEPLERVVADVVRAMRPPRVADLALREHPK